jgi:phosphoribosyl 1,2-cyclic phosphodiesterase
MKLRIGKAEQFDSTFLYYHLPTINYQLLKYNTMRVKFYGVRGSIPICSKEFQRYGGNTTCICIYREAANRVVIFDAGTGIRNLGKEIINQRIKQQVLNIVFSHFHWDHIQGFPFFAPAYNKDQEIGILVMGKQRRFHDLREIFCLPLQEEYFPVELDEMGAKFNFLNLGDETIFYGARVTGVPQYHMFEGGSYGFRIDDDSVSLAICTDVEHINGIDPQIVNFARHADLLIHDGQYTSEEYKRYRGWGHSTWQQAVEVAMQAQVKKLVITHHDPDHDDDFLDALERECQQVFPDCILAKEGMEMKV